MSPSQHGVALFFYNFASILCLSFNNQIYQISNKQALRSVIKMALCPVIYMIFLFCKACSHVVFNTTILSLENYSTFAVFAFYFEIYLEDSHSMVLFIFLLLQRKKTQHLLNTALRMLPATKYMEKFRKMTLKSFLATNIFYVVVFIFQFVGICKVSAFNLIVYSIMAYPMLILFAFVGFVKHFEKFVVCLLKDFNHDMKMCFRENRCDHENFIKLSMKHQQIFDLVEFFNKNFGRPLTFFVCIGFLALLFNVTILNDVYQINNIFLFFSLSIVFKQF